MELGSFETVEPLEDMRGSMYGHISSGFDLGILQSLIVDMDTQGSAMAVIEKQERISLKVVECFVSGKHDVEDRRGVLGTTEVPLTRLRVFD